MEFEQFGHDIVYPPATVIEEYVETLLKIKRRQAPHDLPKPLEVFFSIAVFFLVFEISTIKSLF